MSRCSKYSRAWGCRCELEAGHVDKEGKPSICVSKGDGFWGTCAQCEKQTECECHKDTKKGT
jgi:hypothetical protein